MNLYTISKMAKILKIPESTARYYRDRHSDYFYYKGKGRKKRYTAEALEALRIICEMANSSKTAIETEERLSKEFSRFIEVEEETAISIAGEQQHKFLEVISNSLRNISDQRNELQQLRKEIDDLKAFIYKNRLSWLHRLFKKLKND